jgi:hypothetical protein
MLLTHPPSFLPTTTVAIPSLSLHFLTPFLHFEFPIVSQYPTSATYFLSRLIHLNHFRTPHNPLSHALHVSLVRSSLKFTFPPADPHYHLFSCILSFLSCTCSLDSPETSGLPRVSPDPLTSCLLSCFLAFSTPKFYNQN